MSTLFNADEIFEIAEQIERNGAKFYRKAAEGVSEGKKLLLHLAEMEDQHLETFAAMRADSLKHGQVATIDPAFDPEGEAALYLRAMADGHIFDVNSDTSELLTGKEMLGDILHIAIGKEKDSVVFYTGMKEMVSERLGKGRIADIIKEEMKHIRVLSEELQKLNKVS